MQSKSFFGPYTIFIDELGHCLLAAIVSISGYLLGLSFLEALSIFLAGAFLIDIDHVFNSTICRRILKIPEYKGTLKSGDKGYAPNLFHGFDVAVIFGAVFSMWYGPLFGFTLFASLSLHLLWDFVVYPFRASFLLLCTRASRRFAVGMRNYMSGRIFDIDSLKY